MDGHLQRGGFLGFLVDHQKFCVGFSVRLRLSPGGQRDPGRSDKDTQYALIVIRQFTFCQLFLVHSFVAISSHPKITVPKHHSKAVGATKTICVTLPTFTPCLPFPNFRDSPNSFVKSIPVPPKRKNNKILAKSHKQNPSDYLRFVGRSSISSCY